MLLAWTGQHDASIALFRRAVDLDPNFTKFRFVASAFAATASLESEASETYVALQQRLRQ
jgi:hypothetical protein